MISNDKILFIFERIKNNDEEAYLVGGYVRDLILKKTPNDADFACSASPQRLKEIFSDCKILETGIKHGTLTLVLDHTPFEITTFRTEDGYSDRRHPDKISFTSDIFEDLKRRDFTIGSIAYNPQKGLLDPYDGVGDIERKIIRCVGDPKERFSEDPLRILRGLRFSSVLNFKIEEETAKAMFEKKELLNSISKERIFAEMKKLLCGENAFRVLRDFREVFAEIIPELKSEFDFDQHNFHHCYDLYTHSLFTLKNTPEIFHLRFAALLHDIGKPDCLSFDEKGVGHFYSHAQIGEEKTEKILLRLKCDNKTKNKILTLIRHHDGYIEEKEGAVKRKIGKIGSDLFFDLISLQKADTLALSEEFRERLSHFQTLEEIAEKVLKEKECTNLKALEINGNDLINLGLSGKEIGLKLKEILSLVIDGKIKNEKNILLEYAKNCKS